MYRKDDDELTRGKIQTRGVRKYTARFTIVFQPLLKQVANQEGVKCCLLVFEGIA